MKFAQLIAATFFLFITKPALNQTLQNTATNAFMITRMMDKAHLKPRTIDEQFSADVFRILLEKLDPEKIYFTVEDILQLQNYKAKLHLEILNRKTNFIEQLANLYLQKLQMVDTVINITAKQKININLPDKLTVAEDTNYAANLTAQKQKIFKIIKYGLLQTLADALIDEERKPSDKKFVDSLEIIYRKKNCEALSRQIQKKLQHPGGVQQLVGTMYCEAIAVCYDPHSEFFTTTQRENFESAIGKHNMAFGFSLNQNSQGETIIHKLMPGSPAFKSGLVNKGDRIIALQWNDAKTIDLSTANIDEISDMLSLSNHDKATITFLKADGTKQLVTLSKELSTVDADEDKVSSYVLKGIKNIGYISLPSFYEDWENENSLNGCSNDVAKEILKLKKENIAGLIIDLRYNGGGSLQEAVQLAGLFIDAGPVAQIKKRNAKPITAKDINRGTIYDGPLTILVNGFSASASELIAGALQDYNRALIVGSNTYGKATGQTIYPIDTTINFESYNSNNTGNAIKITTSQLFQASGKTAQFTGVIPDIALPDITNAYKEKESSQPFALPSTNIEANKYYLPLKALSISDLKAKAQEYEQADSSFLWLKKSIAAITLNKKSKDYLLTIEDCYKQTVAASNDSNAVYGIASNKSAAFTATNANFEKERLAAKQDFAALNELIKTKLQNDAQIIIAYKLLLLMSN